MVKVFLNIPNDTDSEDDMEAAISEYYYGFSEACKNDGYLELYNCLEEIAEMAGLKFLLSTDFGCVYEGTSMQASICIDTLPRWAVKYAHLEDI